MNRVQWFNFWRIIVVVIQMVREPDNIQRVVEFGKLVRALAPED